MASYLIVHGIWHGVWCWDRTLHPDTQRWMATRATHVVAFATDHSPFKSMPDAFAEPLHKVEAVAS
jgi:hypothetical protein